MSVVSCDEVGGDTLKPVRVCFWFDDGTSVSFPDCELSCSRFVEDEHGSAPFACSFVFTVCGMLSTSLYSSSSDQMRNFGMRGGVTSLTVLTFLVVTWSLLYCVAALSN